MSLDWKVEDDDKWSLPRKDFEELKIGNTWGLSLIVERDVEKGKMTTHNREYEHPDGPYIEIRYFDIYMNKQGRVIVEQVEGGCQEIRSGDSGFEEERQKLITAKVWEEAA